MSLELCTGAGGLSPLTSWSDLLLLKLYFASFRKLGQAFGKLFRRHGRVDVLDHFAFGRKQIEVSGMGDLHAMKILLAFRPESDFRAPRIGSWVMGTRVG